MDGFPSSGEASKGFSEEAAKAASSIHHHDGELFRGEKAVSPKAPPVARPPMVPPGNEPGDEPGDAQTQADRVAAETFIRTTAQMLANGAPIKDLDGIVQRNRGNVTLADIRSGRLGANVLGDIINEVEKAKSGTPFNWSAATPQQISAYLQANGHPLGLVRLEAARGPASNDRDTTGTRTPVDAAGKTSPGTWEPSSGGAGLTAENFAGTEFFKSGLDLGTTKEMFRQGFDRHEIVKAATDAGSLGVPVNKDAPLIADLKKHDPQFMPRAHQSKDHWHQYYQDENDIKRTEENIAKLRQAGKSAEADALQAKNDAAKKKHDSDKQHHEKFDDDTVRSTSKPRQGKAKTVFDDIRRKEQELSPSLDTYEKASGIDGNASRGIIRSYHHNPNDPIAKGRYAALLQSGDHSPASQRAVAEIDKTIKQAARLKDLQTAINTKDVAKNKDKAIKKAVAAKVGDDMFVALNSSDAAKPETKSEPKKAASKAEPSKPKPTKTVQAKPAALHA